MASGEESTPTKEGERARPASCGETLYMEEEGEKEKEEEEKEEEEEEEGRKQ